MPAVLDVEVLPTFNAQALTVFLANGADGNFQQRIIAQQFGKINLPVFRKDKPGIGHRAAVKSVEFGKRPLEVIIKIYKTADTFQRSIC